MTEDLVQVLLPPHGHEGTAGIGRGAGKARIVVGDEMLTQIAIRGGEGPDPGDPELVDEPCAYILSHIDYQCCVL